MDFMPATFVHTRRRVRCSTRAIRADGGRFAFGSAQERRQIKNAIPDENAKRKLKMEEENFLSMTNHSPEASIRVTLLFLAWRREDTTGRKAKINGGENSKMVTPKCLLSAGEEGEKVTYFTPRSPASTGGIHFVSSAGRAADDGSAVAMMLNYCDKVRHRPHRLPAECVYYE